MARRPWTPALLALLLATAGCGREVVGGGQKEVETVAVGDGTPDGTASRASLAGTGRSAAVLPGTLVFTGRASLVAEDGRVFPLGAGPREVRVRLDGGERAEVSRGTVPRARYVRARVVFTEVAAEVGAGVPGIVGTVRVNIPARDSVVVERTVALEPDRARDTLVVDLNASAWVGAAVGGLVSPTAFAAAVRVTAE